MDLELLFWLLILLAPLLSRLFKKMTGPEPQPERPERPSPTGEARPGPLEEALRQIREALEEANVDEAPAPRREPVAIPPAPPPPKPRPAPPLPAPLPLATARFDEDLFEAGKVSLEKNLIARTSPIPASLPVQVRLKKSPPTVPPPAMVRTGRLKNAAELREAIILATLLGPPRSRADFRDAI